MPACGGYPFSTPSEGTQWLIDWLVERWRSASQIIVDGKGGAGYLVSALRDAGVPSRVIWTPNVGQVIAAHSLMAESISSGLVSHSGQPELDEQVRDAGKRKIGNDGGFAGWRARIRVWRCLRLRLWRCGVSTRLSVAHQVREAG